VNNALEVAKLFLLMLDEDEKRLLRELTESRARSMTDLRRSLRWKKKRFDTTLGSLERLGFFRYDPSQLPS